MSLKLNSCRQGDRVKIVKIEAGRGAALNLMNLGLNAGNTVTIRQHSHLRGPVLVLQGETEIAIGYNLAGKIIVEKIA